MNYPATEYTIKTAGPFFSGAVGGLPYALGERAALYENPELTAQEQNNLPNAYSRSAVAGGKTLLPVLAGSIGGAALGMGAGALGSYFANHHVDDAAMGMGAGVGALLGGTAVGIPTAYNAGKSLAQEEIDQMRLPKAERQTLYQRHPVASIVGHPLNALGMIIPPLWPGRLLVGGVSSMAGWPDRPQEQVQTVRQRPALLT